MARHGLPTPDDGHETPDDGHEQRAHGARRPLAKDGPDVSTDVVESMKDAASGGTPVLRPRTVLGALGATIRHRPFEVRRCP